MAQRVVVITLLSCICQISSFVHNSAVLKGVHERSEVLLGSNESIDTRRQFFAGVLISTGTILSPQDTLAYESSSIPWETNPINKRTGTTVQDAEKFGYNLAFVTYLTRFLLNFDRECQKWWFASSPVSARDTAEEIETKRRNQFAALSASVEVGLQAYKDPKGSKELLERLTDRYGNVDDVQMEDEKALKRMKREARAAKRHIALLFGLLDKKMQPTRSITELLAAVDNGFIETVDMLPNKTFAGYSSEPTVVFPQTEAVGEEFKSATGTTRMKVTGRILSIAIKDPGAGYSSLPSVSVSRPANGRAASFKVKIRNAGECKGQIEAIQVVDGGSGYLSTEPITVSITEPDSAGGRPAVLGAVRELEIEGITVTDRGSGYAIEKPLKVSARSPTGDTEALVQIATATPKADISSYSSIRKEEDKAKVREYKDSFKREPQIVAGSSSGRDSSLPPRPFWGADTSSSQLLDLLPSGIGLQFDNAQKQYNLAVDEAWQRAYPSMIQSNRPINPDFGPRARAPIERDMKLGFATYLRFSLSGALCASGVHLVLVPLDVAKTKSQINPQKYDFMSSSFASIARKEGLSTFFTGWLPTLVGNFMTGAVLYALTEFIRRSLSDIAGANALTYEVPIILAASGVASTLGAVISCPFEAVRIRTVAQPEFAPNAVSACKKMYNEEGLGSFVNAIPVFVLKNVPYAMTKFTVFDISTERLYDAFPAAHEQLKLSLLITLAGGVTGGISAALVSNPADTVISEMKKSKAKVSPQEALSNILERAGGKGLFKGLTLRMFYYSLVASLQFLVYDSVRLALNIGTDDLKEYFDVLGGALNSRGGPL